MTVVTEKSSLNKLQKVRFYVLAAANVKITAFWDVAPCSVVEIGRRFKGAYCLHHQGDDGSSTHL
jgi:hypothetical protein